MLSDSTSITLTVGLLGAIVSGAGVWSVALYRLRQCEREISEVRSDLKAQRDREELLRTEREAIRHRLTKIEARGVPVMYPEAPTPIQPLEP